jgi:hypothetical protein
MGRDTSPMVFFVFCLFLTVFDCFLTVFLSFLLLFFWRAMRPAVSQGNCTAPSGGLHGAIHGPVLTVFLQEI